MEPLHELKGLLAVVAIENADRDIFHIERGGKGEDEELDDRRKKNRNAAAWIAQDGEELFPDER